MDNPAPYNVLQLRFQAMDEFTAYWTLYNDLGHKIWRWHETLGNVEELRSSGICDVCTNLTQFYVRTEPSGDPVFPHRARWGDFMCESCGIGAYERHLIAHVSAHHPPPARLYHVGYYSKLARYFAASRENCVRSQYVPGMAPGHVDEQGVRYEDVTRLSFGSGEFAALVCSDVLEHVPAYKPALHEMHRVLQDGGSAVLTFPWLGGGAYDTLVRAEMLEDGTVLHHLPPEYHWDPASPEGILSFRSFGWDILDELRAVGFREVFAEYRFAPLHGYMTLSSPIIVARK